MCGIAGSAGLGGGPPPDVEVLLRMAAVLHRVGRGRDAANGLVWARRCVRRPTPRVGGRAAARRLVK